MLLPFLALGDSYTIGEGVAPAERWPAIVAKDARSLGTPLADPMIIARTGWTTDELSAGIDGAAVTGDFALVSLLIGVNDQYRGRSARTYRMGFRGLLERAVDFAAGRPAAVIVLSIPDWGVTPFAHGRDRAAIAREIDAFNSACREECDARGTEFVDVTAVSRAAEYQHLLAPDGLHPAVEMYRRWAELVMPAAMRALAPR